MRRIFFPSFSLTKTNRRWRRKSQREIKNWEKRATHIFIYWVILLQRILIKWEFLLRNTKGLRLLLLLAGKILRRSRYSIFWRWSRNIFYWRLRHMIFRRWINNRIFKWLLKKLRIRSNRKSIFRCYRSRISML